MSFWTWKMLSGMLFMGFFIVSSLWLSQLESKAPSVWVVIDKTFISIGNFPTIGLSNHQMEIFGCLYSQNNLLSPMHDVDNQSYRQKLPWRSENNKIAAGKTKFCVLENSWKSKFRTRKFKMPVQELPEEFLRPIESPSNSSLSSNSSDVILINAHYVRNSRSESVSSSTTNTQDEDSFEANVNVSANNSRNRHQNEMDEEEATYQPIKLPTEPTLEELLVRVENLF